MTLIVQKYGGTSLGSMARIQAVAERVVKRYHEGNHVVVVASAIGKTTDELLGMAKTLSDSPRTREMGMLLSAGEVISSALLAMAIQSLGVSATALTGAQSGISASGSYDNARIKKIEPERIHRLVDDGEIVVVAGYQGQRNEDVAVLGRGGSDASAVALAAALSADCCEIYSDVPGVLSCDPRIVENARLLPRIAYEEMLELAASGAQVMMGRSIEIARKFALEILVSSAFKESPGTVIGKKETIVEKSIITGIALQKDIARIDVHGHNGEGRFVKKLLAKIAGEEIGIQLLTSGKNNLHSPALSFTVNAEEAEKTAAILKQLLSEDVIADFSLETDVAQVSLVGFGISENHGIVYEVFDALGSANIDILMTSTSEIKISVIVPKRFGEASVRELHQKFALAFPPGKRKIAG